ncbi:uncharacterized protein SAPINGB_P001108 [Magnusiomyces paraingens]|uniref:Uncharacterized protein n=1 Tax=Magnusiomyces paraingens TaxID=2606893 RepID=A0A5E8B5V4_9ASCO|nr:uncharacterized protein SAPINGB_P001108 [Saprochaete ingens]VVT46225.1 unnamed protein product [Saprochaete ingens]
MARVARLSVLSRVAIFAVLVTAIGFLLVSVSPSSDLSKRSFQPPSLVQNSQQRLKSDDLTEKVSKLDMDNYVPEPEDEESSKNEEKEEYGLPVPMYVAITSSWPFSSTSSWANSRLASILKRKKNPAHNKGPYASHIKDSTPIVQVSPVVKNLKPVVGSRSRYISNLKKQNEETHENKADGFNMIWAEGQLRKVKGSGDTANQMVIDESEFDEYDTIDFEEAENPKFADLDNSVDWSKFAYVQYVTNAVYLCNSVMIFEQLQRVGSRAQRVLMYPEEWNQPGFFDPPTDPAGPGYGFKEEIDEEAHEKAQEEEVLKAQENKAPNRFKRDIDDSVFDQSSMAHNVEYLLKVAVMKYNAILKPVKTAKLESVDPALSYSFTKMHIFNQTEYDRVLFLDSDGSVRRNMDHLFLLPSAPVATTKQYWVYPSDSDGDDGFNADSSVDKDLASFIKLNTHMELVEPSASVFNYILKFLSESMSGGNSNLRGNNEYEGDVFNKLFKDDAMVFPHYGITILTNELRNVDSEHRQYVGKFGKWDASQIFNKTLYVHFSDANHPKPWVRATDQEIRENSPKCSQGGTWCPERQIWLNLYHDFEIRRTNICHMPMMLFDKEQNKYVAAGGISSPGSGSTKNSGFDTLYQALLEEERLQEALLLKQNQQEEEEEEEEEEVSGDVGQNPLPPVPLDAEDEEEPVASKTGEDQVEEQDQGVAAPGVHENQQAPEQEQEQRDQQEQQ